MGGSLIVDARPDRQAQLTPRPGREKPTATTADPSPLGRPGRPPDPPGIGGSLLTRNRRWYTRSAVKRAVALPLREGGARPDRREGLDREGDKTNGHRRAPLPPRTAREGRPIPPDGVLGFELAEREGFEPSRELQTPYSLSRRAPSTARPPLRVERGYQVAGWCDQLHSPHIPPGRRASASATAHRRMRRGQRQADH